MKSWIKKILILLKTLFKYGFAAFKKRLNHFRDCDQCSLKDIQSIHIVPEEELRKQRQEKFSKPIKFSIITPLYNTPKEFLLELIESLQAQTYSNWELCLADGSDDQHQYVGNICKEYAKTDSRIIYHHLSENKGISENTNECIKLATGDYYGLLDHDDILHPSALYEACKAINEENADFIYTDEVKFSNSIYDIKDLKAFNLKPGFGMDDLRSHNFICHFTVFDKNLLKDEENFYRSEFDGSQDHDMVLRLTEKASKIFHINKVLYYWRVHSNSVAMNLDVKAYAVDAAIKAISDQLSRNNELGNVMSSAPFRTIYRVEYPIKNRPLISIILWNVNTERQAKKVVDKIKHHTRYANLEYIYLSKSSEHTLDKNLKAVSFEGNLSEQINEAIRVAQGEYILLLNGELRFMTQNWIDELLMHAQRNQVGTVGAKVYNKDGSIRCAGISLSNEYEDSLYHLGQNNYQGEIGYEAILCHVRNVTANSKDCLMFKKEVWNTIGSFSEELYQYLDVDFCLIASQKGFRNIWVPYSEVFLSSLPTDQISKQQSKVFESKWNSEILNDKHSNSLWHKLKLV